MANIQEDIISFIQENFIAGRSDTELVPDGSLIDSGIIDSTGILELVLFIEEKYSIEVDDEELVPENLDSINNLVSYLKKKGVE